jgi:molybdopterin biosynthesis enzyme MoaB
MPPNAKSIYPGTSFPSLADNQEELDADLKQFLDSKSAVVYAAFGTAFTPTNETVAALLTYANRQSDFGFIFGLSKLSQFSPEVQLLVKNSGPNVLVKAWLP